MNISSFASLGSVTTTLSDERHSTLRVRGGKRERECTESSDNEPAHKRQKIDDADTEDSFVVIEHGDVKSGDTETMPDVDAEADSTEGDYSETPRPKGRARKKEKQKEKEPAESEAEIDADNDGNNGEEINDNYDSNWNSDAEEKEEGESTYTDYDYEHIEASEDEELERKLNAVGRSLYTTKDNPSDTEDDPSEWLGITLLNSERTKVPPFQTKYTRNGTLDTSHVLCKKTKGKKSNPTDSFNSSATVKGLNETRGDYNKLIDDRVELLEHKLCEVANYNKDVHGFRGTAEHESTAVNADEKRVEEAAEEHAEEAAMVELLEANRHMFLDPSAPPCIDAAEAKKMIASALYYIIEEQRVSPGSDETFISVRNMDDEAFVFLWSQMEAFMVDFFSTAKIIAEANHVNTVFLRHVRATLKVMAKMSSQWGRLADRVAICLPEIVLSAAQAWDFEQFKNRVVAGDGAAKEKEKRRRPEQSSDEGPKVSGSKKRKGAAPKKKR